MVGRGDGQRNVAKPPPTAKVAAMTRRDATRSVHSRTVPRHIATSAPSARRASGRVLTPVHRGSSARAEIDPTVHVDEVLAEWFLRTRGDRPHSRGMYPIGLQVPPHARRSTLEGAPSTSAAGGSSARAEIDPPGTVRAHPQTRFLRTRGDRPECGVVRVAELGVPPHARGSTPFLAIASTRNFGASARAEIDPRRTHFSA